MRSSPLKDPISCCGARTYAHSAAESIISAIFIKYNFIQFYYLTIRQQVL